MKIIFDDSLETIDCSLKDFASELGNRLRRRYYGTLSILLPTDYEKVYQKINHHFMLTNDYEKTYILECYIDSIAISKCTFNDTMHITETSPGSSCTIRFNVIEIGKRSLPLSW